MRSRLHPNHYRDESVYRSEKETLFASVWQYAGLKSSLSQPQDFICRDLGGDESVILQNFNGEIRAFQNVCSHRHARLKSTPCGNGPLQCPYHGWTFDQRGFPSVIPGKPLFDFRPEDQAALSLKSYAVSECGGLLFVRRSSSGPSLQEFLGDAFSAIHSLGEAIGAPIASNHFDVRANWKTWVENSLEGYHVHHVHRDSIAKFVPAEKDHLFWQRHSGLRAPIVSGDKTLDRSLHDFLRDRVLADEDYLHYFIFPNLCISATRGMTIDLIRIIPRSPGKTRIESELHLGKFKDPTDRKTGAVLRAYAEMADEFARRIHFEDRGIVEQVALGVSEARDPAFLSQAEDRIDAFHCSLAAYLKTCQKE